MFHEARAPTGDELQALLAKIITRILKCLTRQGHLIKEQGISYLGVKESAQNRGLCCHRQFAIPLPQRGSLTHLGRVAE